MQNCHLSQVLMLVSLILSWMVTFLWLTAIGICFWKILFIQCWDWIQNQRSTFDHLKSNFKFTYNLQNLLKNFWISNWNSKMIIVTKRI
jgi:hypothetical protein